MHRFAVRKNSGERQKEGKKEKRSGAAHGELDKGFLDPLDPKRPAKKPVRGDLGRGRGSDQKANLASE